MGGLYIEEKFYSSGSGYLALTSLGSVSVGFNDWQTGLDNLYNKIKGSGISLSIVTDGSLGGTGNQLLLTSQSKTKASANDILPSTLDAKLSAGDGIHLSTASFGAAGDKVVISSTGQMPLTTSDTTWASLGDKIIPGAGITITQVVDGTYGQRMVINAKGNSWRLVKYVTSNYIVLDTDDTIIIRANGLSITLPAPSASYEGRIVTLRSAQVGYTAAVIGSIVGVISLSGLGKLEYMCYNTGAGYFWVQQ
jgi:hypothetical protein